MVLAVFFISYFTLSLLFLLLFFSFLALRYELRGLSTGMLAALPFGALKTLLRATRLLLRKEVQEVKTPRIVLISQFGASSVELVRLVSIWRARVQ